MEPPCPLIPQRGFQPVEDGGIIGFGLDAAQRPGVQVAKINAGG